MNLQAQATYSPYSMLGLGEIENRDYGRTAGMSNLGIGVRDFDYLNIVNPAGISGLDSLKFIFDLSAAGKLSYFTRNGKTDDTFNGNMKKISMGFRLAPGWGISLGTRPFSDVGYQIYSEEPIEGSTETKSVYLEGSGGLYELYLSNGFKVTDNFSVGINTKYISGTLKQTENQSEYLFEKESRVSRFYNTFGIQYHTNGLTLGATYGYKQNISMDNKTTIYDNGYNLIQEEKDRSTDQFIPETFGAGFSHIRKKIIWGMDFQYQKWEGIDPGISSIKISDSYRINAGLGYTLGSNRFYRYRDQRQMQVGASFCKPYIQAGGGNAYNYSVSAGYSFPFSGSLFNLSVEYGNSLSAPANYIKESYFMLTFNCSIIDQWFKQRKFD
ncbi:hypothetical protein [uncultured Proteiniphilum sp.]|uniref:hypothetical protein n=1 Tax=uncultured Proteiniphilum sp. TaxID=497637 RepID=UPI00263797BC|nr:hypothetical protein [uncultured Proteiniphilum sp.]